MNLEWRNVDVELVNNNSNVKGEYVRLISNSNGNIKSGSLCAIMGPSGSGKTTLLKALTGRIPSGSKTRGEILVNGKQRDYETWSKNIGYVDQDDCVFEQLTVFETVSYAAKFRLKDQSINVDEKVEKLLEELEISDISGSKMKSISGGERKRTMIAIELITDPNILFLDEPTSGLDSSTSLNIIELMKSLSESHKMTVVFTIHQPSVEIFNIFDQLILLSDSHTVYSGEAKQTEEYFLSYGLKKRELSTFPDFLSEALKVKKKYRELPENQAVLSKMINDTTKNYSKSDLGGISKSNSSIVDILPNTKHIFILLKRRCKLYFTFKRTLATLLIFGFTLFNYIKATNGFLKSDEKIKSFIEQILSILEKFDLPLLREFNDQFLNHIDSIFIVLKEMMVANFMSIIFAYSLISSTGAFSVEYKMTKREMGVATYSIGSYYLSVFLFETLIYLPLFILTGILARVFIGDIIKWSCYLFFLGGIIGYLPLILFFGSLTSRTKTMYVIVSFLALTWFLPASVFCICNFTAIKKNNAVARSLCLLLSIFTPYQYNCLCVGVAHKLALGAVKSLQGKSDFNSACDYIFKILYSFLYESMQVWSIFVIFIITTIIFIGFSLLALNLRLSPEMRYKLSK